MINRPCFILVLFFIGMCATQSIAQRQSIDQVLDNTLVPLAHPVNCELALRYIDDSINRSVKEPAAAFIVLVKSRKGETPRVTQGRKNEITWYLKYRGVSNFEVASSESGARYGSYELFVFGRRIYSIPLTLNTSLKLRGCVAV